MQVKLWMHDFYSMEHIIYTSSKTGEYKVYSKVFCIEFSGDQVVYVGLWWLMICGTKQESNRILKISFILPMWFDQNMLNDVFFEANRAAVFIFKGNSETKTDAQTYNNNEKIYNNKTNNNKKYALKSLCQLAAVQFQIAAMNYCSRPRCSELIFSVFNLCRVCLALKDLFSLWQRVMRFPPRVISLFLNCSY